MLTNDEFLQLCRHLGFSDGARALIEKIRSGPPSRRVQSGGKNVCVRYPSRKMGITIQAESHTNALAGIYEYEYDPEVLEYYDQPPSLKLEYLMKNGHKVSFLYVVDFFVIRSNAAGWEEWKTEEELQSQSDKSNRYLRGEDGRWRCPSGEQYAGQLSLDYRVRSSAEIDWTFQRNIIFLEDYLRGESPVTDEVRTEKILSLVAEKPGIGLNDLIDCADHATSDDIHNLIATGQLYVDLRAGPLAEPQRVRVFRDEPTARAYGAINEASSRRTENGPRIVDVAINANVFWDGKLLTIINLGETTIWLRAENAQIIELPRSEFEALVQRGELTGPVRQMHAGLNDEARELLSEASPSDLAEANRRSEWVRARRAGLPGNGEISAFMGEEPANRTQSLWAANAKAAEQKYGVGCGFLGLLPRVSKRGNRARRLPEDTRQVVEEFVKKYETTQQPRKRAIYGALVLACKERGTYAPSYKTFAQEIRRRPTFDQVKKRQGGRAAYPHEPFYWNLEPTTSRHGDRPFEIGHIDHTQLDLELVHASTNRNLGRPWVTFLVDAFSRRVLALYLAFDPPSYRSCMMVLRECVRRHGRLPQIIVVDGGSEFASSYFETLLARYESTKKTRPPAKARFGSVIERLFGTTNTQFIDNLAGNTQIMKNVRQVTKTVNPKRNALWTFSRLFEYLSAYVYEVYDTIEHPALGQSPREAFQTGLVRAGERPHRLIPYDDDFVMYTLPTTRRGEAKIQPNLGVKINYIYYWSAEFRDPEVEKTEVPVRYDPFDMGTAHAFVKGRWVRCVSQFYHILKGRSEREIMQATAELRKQNQNHGAQSAITVQKLAAFLASAKAEEVLLEQRQRDVESKSMLAVMTRNGQAVDGHITRSVAVEPAIGGGEAEPGEADREVAQDSAKPVDAPRVFEDY